VTGTAFDIIPVNVLTGFLGSGKTTLLRRLLSSERSGETAVLMNEFGAVGIDHLLVGEIAPDIVLLKSGCVCCSIRGELRDAFVQLFSRRQKGDVPPFRRIILETTGLADPAPILATLLADPVLRHHFRIGLVIAVVDCVNADVQQSLYTEWTSQVTAADRLIISKADLVPQETCAALQHSLLKVNSSAPIVLSADIDAGDLLLLDAGLHGPVPQTEVQRWMDRSWNKSLNEISEDAEALSHHQHAQYSAVTSFCLVFEEQINWTAFGLWLSMLLNRHGRNVLRVKGILNLSGANYPVAIHGVQHLVHPPVHLPAWPDEDRRSRIVFIVRGIEKQAVERSFKAFCEHLE
jgi:G3E family GTPase